MLQRGGSCPCTMAAGTASAGKPRSPALQTTFFSPTGAGPLQTTPVPAWTGRMSASSSTSDIAGERGAARHRGPTQGRRGSLSRLSPPQGASTPRVRSHGPTHTTLKEKREGMTPALSRRCPPWSSNSSRAKCWEQRQAPAPGTHSRREPGSTRRTASNQRFRSSCALGKLRADGGMGQCWAGEGTLDLQCLAPPHPSPNP